MDMQLASLALEGGQIGVLALVAFRLGRVLSKQEFHDARLNKLEKYL